MGQRNGTVRDRVIISVTFCHILSSCVCTFNNNVAITRTYTASIVTYRYNVLKYPFHYTYVYQEFIKVCTLAFLCNKLVTKECTASKLGVQLFIGNMQ